MSDVTVAAPDAAPQDIPANEVAIDVNPVSTPQPIGSQAPEKSPREARMEAIQKAYDRATDPRNKESKTSQRAPAKAAEAKPGHNQPPEETPKEKLDLRKPPVADRPRSDHGHFAPKTIGEANGQDRLAQANGQAEPPRPAKQLPREAPFPEPPPRISESARRDWADTPETVRGDIHRMHHEFGRAYQQYRGAAEAFAPIAHYHQMAQQQGTTLEKALTQYIGIEQKLREDPIGGLDLIVHNLGLVDPETKQRIGLRDISYHVLSRSPEQLQQVQQGNQQTATQHQMAALYREVTGLKQGLQQMHDTARFNYTSQAVDHFAASHPRFDELADLIKNEIDLGFDIDTAYRRAELLRPSTQAAQTRTTPAQTRPADKSISGSPGVTGSNPAHRRPEKKFSREEAIQNAMTAFGGLS